MIDRSKSFSRRIAEGVAWSASASALLKLIGFALTFLLISKLTLHEYGTYQLVLAAYSLLSVFLLGGVDQVVIAEGSRLLGRGEIEQTKRFGLSYGLFFVPIGLVLWAVAFFSPVLLSHWYSKDILGMLPILSWIFLAVPLNRVIQYSFSVRQRFASINIFSLVEESGKLLLMLVFVFFLNRGVQGAILATGIAYSLTSILAFPFLIRWYRGTWKVIEFKPILSLFRGIGKWIISQKAVRQFEKSVRPFVIQFFVGREAVALFSVAEKLLAYLISLIPTDTILIPALAAETGNWERLKRVLERGIKYSVPFFTVVAAIAFVASRPFLSLFFPQYLPSLPLFYVLLVYVPFSGVAYILSSFFVSHHEQKKLFYLIVARFVLAAVLSPLLLLIMGVIGIAWEYVITLVVFNGLRYATLVYTHPELRVSFRALMRIDDYDRHAWRRIITRLTRRG